MTRWLATWTAACLTLVAAPASAGQATEIWIDQAAGAEGWMSVSGRLALGTDAAAPVTVALDATGDDTLPTQGDGLDIGSAALTADLAASALTFTINVNDMSPQLGTVLPTFAYDWQFTVDGATAGFVQAGFTLGYGIIGVQKFYQYCTNDFICTPIPGTMGGGVTTMRVPYAAIGAKPGSVIGTGTTLVNETVSSTWSPWALFHDLGGDGATADDLRLPGAVLLGFGEAGTPEALVETTTRATIQPDGTFHGEIAIPDGPGSYVVVARSCFGVTSSPSCATASRSVTV